MDLMEAIAGLEHGHVAALHIGILDLPVAIFTNTVFFLLLDLFIIGLCALPLSWVHEVIKVHGADLTASWLLIHVWWLEAAHTR